MQRIPILIAVLLPLLHPAAVGADEVIQLVDKTKIVGTLLHYYDGVLSVRLPNGTEMKLPAGKVRRVTFKLPKPRADFATPQKTFKRLRTAALKGDLPTYLDCHSTYYQMFLNHQVELATPPKFVARLKKEWGNVQLEVLNTKVKGNTAVMKVRRKQGGDSQEGEMRFVRENKEWKMILPL
jgi:hypothetical protein